MQFLCPIWKFLHLTEYFYTGTACGARNNYQVWEQVNAENKMKNKISIIDYILFQVDANILRYQNMKF